LRRVASAKLNHPERFWEKVEALPAVPIDRVPQSAIRALGGLLPSAGLSLRFAGRVAGVGSLGRQRFVAIAHWCGGRIAREAKAAARSATFWARPAEGEARELHRTIVGGAVRCLDPFLAVKRRWIVRRLAPDCERVELADLKTETEMAKLLHAMGWETANVHLGSAGAHALLLDLTSLPKGWLKSAVDTLQVLLEADWKAWVAGPAAKAKKK
jgi:hypothetical protein